MAESKEGESFFRKVVKFVANPSTDWSAISSRLDEGREADLEKSELKAMVERKRRNDFVRKREFDVLRRLRREGLSPEQLAALGSSQMEDDVRVSETSLRQDVRVKAKIDEIEQQMVGEGLRNSTDQRAGSYYGALGGQRPIRPTQAPVAPVVRTARIPFAEANRHGNDDKHLPALPQLPEFDLPSASAPAPVTMGAGMAPLIVPARTVAPQSSATSVASVASRAGLAFDSMNGNAIEVSEVVHDPDLDEAVIAFANADFIHCESALTQLVAVGAARYEHAETWHVLFDLYRAIGQQAKFESLALDYANLFGASSPQWFSMPRQVADAAAAADERPKAQRPTGQVGWISPAQLDVGAVAKLRSATLQLPLPWVLDWTSLQGVEVEAASNLTLLFREWATQRVEMRWLSGEQLLSVLHEAAPTGIRDADPAYWMARLEALRLANRPDQFDEVAIDYCVTYEVSPPSWERAKCNARIGGPNLLTTTPPMSVIGEASSNFLESSQLDDSTGVQVSRVELSGQLVGDIGATLTRLDQRLGLAPLVSVSCTRLIRVDFIAAGDLLNWVLAKRSRNRSVTFTESHRLVALFFGAMGINEHARVQVRRD